MQILASSNPLKLSYDLTFDSIAACKVTLQHRRDYDEKLSAAFEELITIAQAEDADMSGSIDSIVESGLFFSAKSSFHSELAEAMTELNSTAVSDSDGSADEVSDEPGRTEQMESFGIATADFAAEAEDMDMPVLAKRASTI